MAGFECHCHILTAGDLRHDIRDIPSDLLLQLEPSSHHVAYARDLGEADDFAFGDIGHRRLHIIHERHVVLTVGKHVDVLHHDDPSGFVRMQLKSLLEGLAEHLRDLMVCIVHALKDFRVHLRHTLGRIFQSFSVRVVSERCQNTPDMFFYCSLVYHNISPVRRRAGPDPRSLCASGSVSAPCSIFFAA